MTLPWTRTGACGLRIPDTAGSSQLDASHDGTWEEARDHDARNNLARDNRDWPMMLADGRGRQLVGHATDRHGGNGDVMVYHPDNGALARIELPEDAYPTDMARNGRLHAGHGHGEIHDLPDRHRHAFDREFGDAAFREMMSRWRRTQVRYVAMVDYSLYGMIGFGSS